MAEDHPQAERHIVCNARSFASRAMHFLNVRSSGGNQLGSAQSHWPHLVVNSLL
jgi:hypothetical protein